MDKTLALRSNKILCALSLSLNFRRVGAILDDSVPSLNAVSPDKKSARVRQADVLTNFSPIDPDKKSAALRQKIG